MSLLRHRILLNCCRAVSCMRLRSSIGAKWPEHGVSRVRYKVSHMCKRALPQQLSTQPSLGLCDRNGSALLLVPID